MPSSSKCFTLSGLSLRQIQRCIPKQWKQSLNRVDDGEFMIETLFKSLQEFATQSRLLEAFRTFSRIQLHSSSTSNDVIAQSISSLILSCANLKSLHQGKQLHAKSIFLGFDKDPVLVPKLVTFYSSFDHLLVDAHTIVVNSNLSSPLPWNVLISAYVRNGLFGETLGLYEEMVSRGVRPDSFTYPSVLKACGEKLDLAFGRSVHESVSASCDGWNLFVHNALVSMYGKTGELDIARSLFDKMPERDAVSWNTMISAYASNGMCKEAYGLFEKMRMEGIEASFITWNTVAGAFVRKGNFKGAIELLSLMKTSGMVLDAVAMVIGLGACSHIRAIRLGAEIHGCAIRSGCDGYENVNNALITMYSRCEDFRHSNILFHMMKSKSIVTWNSMLSGYAHMNQCEEASFLFREMLLLGIEPNYVTIASILPLCSRVANLQHGKEFHCYILRREGFEDRLLVWNSLVDMYSRSGMVVEAKRVFDSMTERDEVTYTSLIAGYGVQGEGKAALKLFDEMNRFQIQPDHVTMVAVLTACSHSGLVAEGKLLFERISTMYDMVPCLEHYACMVDLFGRTGLLHKAKEIITTMPYEPTPELWATLLGACRIHGNTDIGEWAAEKLLEMRPENPGYYVLIANMYADAGCWHKLAEVRTFMRDFGVRKAPGCALVDIGCGFVPFVVGDASLDNANELYMVLEGLTELMKDTGYVAGSNYSLEDELLEEME